APGPRSRSWPRPGPWWRAASGSWCWWPRTSPPTAATPVRPARWPRCSTPSTARRRGPDPRPAPLPLPLAGAGSAGGGHARPRDAGAVLRPVAPARLRAAAQADAAVGERGPVRRDDRRDPPPRAGRRLPVVVHRRIPRRDGGGPRGPAPLPGGRRPRLGRALPVLGRGRHTGGG